VPDVGGGTPPSSKPAGVLTAELEAPGADRLIGHVDLAVREDLLDVAVAERLAEIEKTAKLMTFVGKR
jgi:hypothetical protein